MTKIRPMTDSQTNVRHFFTYSIIVLGFGLSLLFFTSCQERKGIEGFDSTLWKSDRKGCQGLRISLKNQLEKISPQLKRLSNKDVLYVLGRPDKNELYRRNQKFFIYHISPAPDCDHYEASQTPVTLKIRFNAVGLSNEVMIYD